MAEPVGSSETSRTDVADGQSLLDKAVQDSATVSASGEPLMGSIEGVVVHQPPVHSDHRGELVEMFTTPEFWHQPFAYAYQTSIRPGMLKGWFAHLHKEDRYHIVSGELLLLLFDDRPGSPTRGNALKLLLSDRSARQVFVPRRVWHLSLNVGQVDAILVNLPTTHYNHANPDRFHIPFDSPDIPIDVRSYFPVTSAAAHDPAATFC